MSGKMHELLSPNLVINLSSRSVPGYNISMSISAAVIKERRKERERGGGGTKYTGFRDTLFSSLPPSSAPSPLPIPPKHHHHPASTRSQPYHPEPTPISTHPPIHPLPVYCSKNRKSFTLSLLAKQPYHTLQQCPLLAPLCGQTWPEGS